MSGPLALDSGSKGVTKTKSKEHEPLVHTHFI